MKIIKKMTGIVHDRDHDGARYYKDVKGNDWYKFRNSLHKGLTVIVVDSETNLIMTFWKGDPTRVGLHCPDICKSVDVYQLAGCQLSEKDFFGSTWKWVNNNFVEEKIKTPETREYDKKDMLTALTIEIEILKDEIEFGMSDDHEKLKKLRLFRIELSKADVNYDLPVYK